MQVIKADKRFVTQLNVNTNFSSTMCHLLQLNLLMHVKSLKSDCFSFFSYKGSFIPNVYVLY